MAKQIPPRKRNTRSNNPLTNPSSDQEVQHSVDPENRDERIIITGIVGDITPEYSLDGFTPVMSVELDASRGVASEDIEVDSNLLAQVVLNCLLLLRMEEGMVAFFVGWSMYSGPRQCLIQRIQSPLKLTGI